MLTSKCWSLGGSQDSCVEWLVQGCLRVGSGQVRVWEWYNGSGLVGSSNMIAWLGLGLEVYAGKLGWVTGNRIFEYVIIPKYEGWYQKCEKHLHKARFYTNNITQSSKLMITNGLNKHLCIFSFAIACVYAYICITYLQWPWQWPWQWQWTVSAVPIAYQTALCRLWFLHTWVCSTNKMCMYVSMYLCMYACMYVCMYCCCVYVCVCAYVNAYIHTWILCVLCVLCVVDSFSAIGGPLWRYILANILQAWPSMTLVNSLPGPHATARSCLMAKRKVLFPDGGAN